MKYNKNFQLLGESYLFAEIAQKVKAFSDKNPQAKLVNLGIGDVTLPLVPVIVDAGLKATEEMRHGRTFRGYGEYEGYDFLRAAVQKKYEANGVNLGIDDIFIGDGAKSDMAHILTLFRRCTALIPNPVYPVYLDTNIIAGNAVIFSEGNKKNGFLPMPDGRECDLIYLCSPSNPSGATYSLKQLEEWVDYAKLIGAVILFDAAYEAFIEDGSPRSIFEVRGARECAIEFGSLSKTAGFTGTRCGWTIAPAELKASQMWKRYRGSSYNGVSYIVQRMAEAALSPAGQRQTAEQIKIYKNNAAKISAVLTGRGIWHTGGVNSPYIWLECGGSSWQFFDKMLAENGIIGTPGCGFGSAGEGYFRLSAFGVRELLNL